MALAIARAEYVLPLPLGPIKASRSFACRLVALLNVTPMRHLLYVPTCDLAHGPVAQLPEPDQAVCVNQPDRLPWIMDADRFGEDVQ